MLIKNRGRIDLVFCILLIFNIIIFMIMGQLSCGRAWASLRERGLVDRQRRIADWLSQIEESPVGDLSLAPACPPAHIGPQEGPLVVRAQRKFAIRRPTPAGGVAIDARQELAVWGTRGDGNCYFHASYTGPLRQGLAQDPKASDKRRLFIAVLEAYQDRPDDMPEVVKEAYIATLSVDLFRFTDRVDVDKIQRSGLVDPHFPAYAEFQQDLGILGGTTYVVDFLLRPSVAKMFVSYLKNRGASYYITANDQKLMAILAGRPMRVYTLPPRQQVLDEISHSALFLPNSDIRHALWQRLGEGGRNLWREAGDWAYDGTGPVPGDGVAGAAVAPEAVIFHEGAHYSKAQLVDKAASPHPAVVSPHPAVVPPVAPSPVVPLPAGVRRPPRAPVAAPKAPQARQVPAVARPAPMGPAGPIRPPIPIQPVTAAVQRPLDSEILKKLDARHFAGSKDPNQWTRSADGTYHIPKGGALWTSSGKLKDHFGIAGIIHAAPGAMNTGLDQVNAKRFTPSLKSIVISIRNAIRLAVRNGATGISIPLVGGDIFLARAMRGMTPAMNPHKPAEKEQAQKMLAALIVEGALVERENVKADQGPRRLHIQFVSRDEKVNKYFVEALEKVQKQRRERGQDLKDVQTHRGSITHLPQGDTLAWARKKYVMVNAANTEAKFGGGLSGFIAKAVGDQKAQDSVDAEALRIKRHYYRVLKGKIK